MINLTTRKIGILSTSVGAILIGIVPILVRTSEISPALTGFYRFLIASIILFFLWNSKVLEIINSGVISPKLI